MKPTSEIIYDSERKIEHVIMGNDMNCFMKEHLGIDFCDLQKMNEQELEDILDKAFDLELEVAIQANGEITEKGELAAHLVDFINIEMLGTVYGDLE